MLNSKTCDCEQVTKLMPIFSCAKVNLTNTITGLLWWQEKKNIFVYIWVNWPFKNVQSLTGEELHSVKRYSREAESATGTNFPCVPAGQRDSRHKNLPLIRNYLLHKFRDVLGGPAREGACTRVHECLASQDASAGCSALSCFHYIPVMWCFSLRLGFKSGSCWRRRRKKRRRWNWNCRNRKRKRRRMQRNKYNKHLPPLISNVILSWRVTNSYFLFLLGKRCEQPVQWHALFEGDKRGERLCGTEAGERWGLKPANTR